MFDDLFSTINDWFVEEPISTSDDYDYLSIDEEECIYDRSNLIVDEQTDNLYVDDSYFLPTEESINFDYFFEQPEYYPYTETWNVSEFDGVGNPFEDANHWQPQEGQNSCAVVAQRGVLEAITGVDFSEEELCDFAQANGWFDPHTGTYPDDMGKILDRVGVPTQSYYDATLIDIAEALERGDKIIVGLDGSEIFTPYRDEDGNAIEQLNAGHAVWVTGIDVLPDGNVKLILNDSGHDEGKMAVVDAVDFVNAWSDFGNQITVAQGNFDNVIT